jgi:protein-disulfide isomerase
VVLDQFTQKDSEELTYYDGVIPMRTLGALLYLAFADADWQTATALNGVNFAGLTPAQRQIALAALREGDCGCGCAMKIAECRVKDPKCGESTALAQYVIREVKAGRNLAAVRRGLMDKALFADAVPLNLAGAPSRGPENAKLVLTVFSDFQCPYCRKAARNVDELAKMYPNDLRIVFKQYPLESHSEAALAAEASLAAHSQGKFWPFHDRVFQHRGPLSRALFKTWAQELGLNAARFEAEINQGKHKATVARETREGDAANVTGTPTFYVNGRKYKGSMEPAAMKPVLDQMLAGR